MGTNRNYTVINMRDLLLPGLAPSPELAKLRQFAWGLRTHEQGTFIAAVNTAYLNEPNLESARVAGLETLAARKRAIRAAVTYRATDDSATERWLAALLNHPLLNQQMLDGVAVGIELGQQLLKTAISESPKFNLTRVNTFVAVAQEGASPIAHNFGKSLVFVALREVLARQHKAAKNARIVDLGNEENLAAVVAMVLEAQTGLIQLWRERGQRIRAAAIAFDREVEFAYVKAVVAHDAEMLATANPLGADVGAALADAGYELARAARQVGHDSAGHPLPTNGKPSLLVDDGPFVIAA